MKITDGDKILFRKLLDGIEILTPREQQIYKFLYGIPSDREFTQFELSLTLDEVQNYIQLTPHTVEETENEFGITKREIRQILTKLFGRPVHAKRKKRLVDFLE